jgi:hypothetical protein
MNRHEGVRHYDLASAGLACHLSNRAHNFIGTFDAGRDRSDRERGR